MAKLSEIMTKDIQFCRVGDTLSKAAQMMWDHDCGCVPIVDGKDKAVGMLTDRDICMAAQFNGKPLDAINVENAMSKHLFSCKPDDTIEDAEAVMREQQVRRVPILDESKLVGMLSMNDLVRAATEKRWHKAVRAELVDTTLAAISQPRILDGDARLRTS
jgi:predicted transcriptional regulator